MRRAFVGRRGLVAGVGGLGELGFGTGQTVGELRDLPGKLQDHPVLLLHVPLQESEALFEVAETDVHAADDGGVAGRGKPMPALYDKYDGRRPMPCFGGCQRVD